MIMDVKKMKYQTLAIPVVLLVCIIGLVSCSPSVPVCDQKEHMIFSDSVAVKENTNRIRSIETVTSTTENTGNLEKNDSFFIIDHHVPDREAVDSIKKAQMKYKNNQ
jgi:hypothetical protein